MFNRVKTVNCKLVVISCCVCLAGCTNKTVDTVDGNQVQPASISSSQSTPEARQVNARFSEPVQTADSRQHDGPDMLSQPTDRPANHFPRDGQVVNTLRVWSDNNSQYTTNAELLEISLKDRSVKLLKDNGIAITVPIERLSEHDRNFLGHFVATQTGASGDFNPGLVESR